MRRRRKRRKEVNPSPKRRAAAELARLRSGRCKTSSDCFMIDRNSCFSERAVDHNETVLMRSRSIAKPLVRLEASELMSPMCLGVILNRRANKKRRSGLLLLVWQILFLIENQNCRIVMSQGVRGNSGAQETTSNGQGGE